jgi:hypothetical protein
MNLQMKMSEMGAMCQLREDSKGTCVLRLASLKGLGKVKSRFLQVSGFRGFIVFIIKTYRNARNVKI